MAKLNPTQLMNGASALVSGAAGLVGKAFGPVTKGVLTAGTVLTGVWYGNKAFMGENGSASKAEARWQGAEAAEAMHANTTGIKEMIAGWLEIIKDIFPGTANFLNPYIDRLRDNIVRPEQDKTTMESLSEVISPEAGVALAAAPVAGLGVGVYSALKGKGAKDAVADTTAAAPVSGLADKKTLSELSQADQDRFTGKAKVDAKGPSVTATAADAVDDVAKSSLRSSFAKSATRNIAGAVVIGGGLYLGSKVLGATEAEAQDLATDIIPGKDAYIKASEGDYTAAAESAVVDAAGFAGFIPGAAIGATWGASAGALTGPFAVVASPVGGVVGGLVGGVVTSGIASTAADYAWDAGEYVWSKGVDAVNYFWGDDEPEIKSEFAHAADNDNKAPKYIADNTNIPVYKASGMDMVIN